jgi:hypothetical protein
VLFVPKDASQAVNQIPNPMILLRQTLNQLAVYLVVCDLNKGRRWLNLFHKNHHLNPSQRSQEGWASMVPDLNQSPSFRRFQFPGQPADLVRFHRVRCDRQRNEMKAFFALEVAKIEPFGPGMIRARFMRLEHFGQRGRSIGKSDGPLEWECESGMMHPDQAGACSTLCHR